MYLSLRASYFFKALALCLLLLLGARKEGYGQRVYATWKPSSGVLTEGLLGAGGAGVVNPEGAQTSSDSEWAKMRAEQVTAVVPLSKGGSYLQLKFENSLPAKTTVFIKISQPEVVGVNIGVMGLLGLINNGISITAYKNAQNNTNTTTVGIGQALTGSVTTGLMIDEMGEYYIVATPTSTDQFNSIRINLRLPSDITVLALNSLEINVYYAFYNENSQNCGNPLGTDEGIATGVGLNLGSVLNGLGLSLDDIVKNPTFAIDNNVNTASILSPGLLGVANTTSQTIFFNGIGSVTDEVYALLSLNASLLQLGIGDNITFQAYNGEQAVGSPISLKSALLGLDLLTLFANEQKVPIHIAPGGSFDRVKINISTLVGAGGNILGGGVSIWEVQRVPKKPNINDDYNLSICQGQPLNITLFPNDHDSSRELLWYDAAGDLISITPYDGTYSTSSQTENTNYYVAIRKVGCDEISERVKVPIIVYPKPEPPNIIIIDE